MAAAFAVTMLGTTLPTPLYPIYRAELGFSEVTVTVIFAVYAAGVIIALLAFGNAMLIAGMVVLAVSLSAASLLLLVLGGATAGTGQGMAFAAGLASVNAATPAAQRGATVSTYFVVCYVAISLPVIGVGVLAELTDLVVAGTAFAAAVAALALAAIAGVARLQRARAAA